MRTSRVSEQASQADREWIATVPAEDRMAAALRLGEEGLQAFLGGAGRNLGRAEALARLEAARNRGRRLCLWQREPE